MRRAAAIAILLPALLALPVPAPGEPPPVPSPVPYDPMVEAAIEVLVDDQLAGSGWILHPEGLALTAAHLIGKEAQRIEVLWQRTRLPAEVVARDRGRDLVLLRLPPRDGGYPLLGLAAAWPAPGTTLWLLGAPIYRHEVLLHGTAARRGTTFEWYPEHERYVEVTHVAAVVPQGLSGGPWCDDQGRVVALQSGTMTSEGVPVGVGFVVPVEAIRAFLQRGRDVETPTLGAPFEEVWEQSAEVLARYPPRTGGVVVRKPVAGGPLARSGVSEWQVILTVDGRPVHYRDDLLAHVRDRAVGEKVRIELLRGFGGQVQTLEVALGAL